MKWIREVLVWKRAGLEAIPGRIGENLRKHFYGFTSGSGTRVLSYVTIHHPENLIIGDNCGISSYCHMNAKSGITIGNDVLIGPSTRIWTQNHVFRAKNELIRKQGYEGGAVIVEDDAWIALGCTILPGITIGRGSVVAAGSVVTKSTKPYAVVAGVPAVEVKERGEK